MALNSETDGVLQALAKMGGVSRDVMAREFGLKPEELKHTVNVGGLKGFPFRKNGGMQMDRAIEALQEAGYFAGMAGEDVRAAFDEAVYGELGGGRTLTPAGQMRRGAEETEDRARQEREELDAENAAEDAAERAAIMAEDADLAPLDEVPDDELFDLDAKSNAGAEEFMRSMGFTDEEIADELAREATQPRRQEAPDRGAGETDTGEARPPAGARSEEARAVPAEEGLTLETQDDTTLKAKTEREARAADDDIREQKRRADKAKADAERDEFTLTGSDRAVDVGAAAGQEGLFDAPAVGAPPKARVTPQIPSARQIDGFIKVAADSLKTLRRMDVDRVLGETPAHFRLAVAEHIKAGRRDLADEVDEVMAELAPSSTPAKPAATASAPKPAPASRIEDFGETLHGARKEYAAAFKDRMEAAESVDIAAEPLSKSWPEPDYQKLLDGGADPFAVAFVHAARDEVPTKPQTRWKLKGWVQQVELLRRMSNQLMSGEVSADALQERLSLSEFVTVRKHVGGRAELYQAVGHDKSLKGVMFQEHHYAWHYFLEELQFTQVFNHYYQPNVSRQDDKGIFTTTTGANTTRGAAWCMRTLFQACALTPEADPLHGDLLTAAKNNVEFMHARYVAQEHNPFGFVTPYADYTGHDAIVQEGATTTVVPINVNGADDDFYVGWTLTLAGETRTIIDFTSSPEVVTVDSPFSDAPTAGALGQVRDGLQFDAAWMQDFYTAAMGYGISLDLGLESGVKTKHAEFFEWKARSVVGRLGGTAADEFLYRDAAVYTISVAATDDRSGWATGTVTWHADWGAIYEDTIGVPNPGEVGDLRGGNYPEASSYWGNLQPAIAYAVRHNAAGATDAYARMTGASNWSVLAANFNTAPVWGVAPLST